MPNMPIFLIYFKGGGRYYFEKLINEYSCVKVTWFPLIKSFFFLNNKAPQVKNTEMFHRMFP